jgi:stage IV sporulation protein FB
MFGAVSETPYDLRFRFLGIPVRVHPLFWLAGLLLAGDVRDLSVTLMWVACVFISILIHEYGHGLMAMKFDASPSIVLWMGGGLCYNQAERQTPLQRLAVVLSGPGAGFVFCGVVMLVVTAVFGLTPQENLSVLLRCIGLPYDDIAFLRAEIKMRSGYPFLAFMMLVQINALWGLVNLLPVFPLDGGRVSEIALTYVNHYEGKRWGHTLSLVVAGLMAFVSYSLSRSLFLTVFFGYFAFLNYQILQSIHRAQVMGLYDEDWWRR